MSHVGRAAMRESAHDSDDGHFAWCAVNPLNGRLYTSNYKGTLLCAYDKDWSVPNMIRCREDDIPLSYAPSDAQYLQGGVFTSGGKVLLVRGRTAGYGEMYCYSAITGKLVDSKILGQYGHVGSVYWDTGSEIESVTIRACSDGRYVHVLELVNWNFETDDCYLHSYVVPVDVVDTL